MQVRWPSGEQRECLVPIASLLNHSADAHVVRYGSISAVTGRLDMSTARPCKAADQLFLAYGKLNNLRLLLFYGFLLSPDNPHDSITFEFEVRCL